MDSVCKELDEVKLELEKIKGECRIKTELSETLRKANDDQVARYQEVKLQLEKLVQELSVKAEEAAEVRHHYEDVKSRLQESETSLKHASSVNEKLRSDCGEKVQKLEGENRRLVSALDEANSKTSELEEQLHACHKEVAGLKMLLSDSEKKRSEAEQKIEVTKALRVRDDAIEKLEEASMGIQDQLKWKSEQFEHLKEAHRLPQEQFQLSKEEWASEKNALVQELSSLQISLDTQIRMNESLKDELKMCNQALAHEESRRKASERQLAESKECFENVLAECHEAKSKIEKLSMERDEEVAALRNTLGTKKSHIKEMEYRISHLEQENKELLQSVKEFQEAQIVRRKPEPSLAKLRNKLRDLEQAHSCCSMKLEEREAEWNMKMVKILGDMTRCECDLKSKTEENDQLRIQLENCQSSVDVFNEQMSILLMVLKSQFSEACIKGFNLEGDGKHAVSTERETVGDCHLQAQPLLNLERAREKIASLTKKLEPLKAVEHRNTLLSSELSECKKKLEESSICQLRLEEHAALMEASVKEMRDFTAELEKEKAWLEKECKKKESLVELARSEAEKLKQEMKKLDEQAREEIASLRKMLESFKTVEDKNVLLADELDVCKKKLEESSVCQIRLKEHAALMEASAREMRDATNDLQKERALLEQECKIKESLIRSEAEKFKHEMEKLDKQAKEEIASLSKKVKFLKRVEEENMLLANELETCKKMLGESSICQLRLKEHAALTETSAKEMRDAITDLQKEKAQLEECQRRESLAVELARSEAEKFKHEMEKICFIVEDKDRSIRDLEACISIQEQKFMDALISSFSESLEMLIKTNALEEALEETEHVVAAAVQCKREESLAVEQARSEAEQFKYEMVKLRNIAKEKDQTIMDLQAFISVQEQNFTDAVALSISESFEMLIKTSALREALKEAERIIAAAVEEKRSLVSEYEKETTDFHAKTLHFEELLSDSQNRVNDLETLLRHKIAEFEDLKDNLSNVQSKHEKAEKELHLTKQAFTGNISQLSREKEALVAYYEEVIDRLGGFSGEDAKLMDMLDKMLQNCEGNGVTEGVATGNGAGNLVDDASFSSTAKGFEGNIEKRSPLRELNHCH